MEDPGFEMNILLMLIF